MDSSFMWIAGGFNLIDGPQVDGSYAVDMGDVVVFLNDVVGCNWVGGAWHVIPSIDAPVSFDCCNA